MLERYSLTIKKLKSIIKHCNFNNNLVDISEKLDNIKTALKNYEFFNNNDTDMRKNKHTFEKIIQQKLNSYNQKKANIDVNKPIKITYNGHDLANLTVNNSNNKPIIYDADCNFTKYFKKTFEHNNKSENNNSKISNEPKNIYTKNNIKKTPNNKKIKINNTNPKIIIAILIKINYIK